MTKVKIDCDEMYPVYSLGTNFGLDRELTEQELKIIEKSWKEFQVGQDIMERAYKNE